MKKEMADYLTRVIKSQKPDSNRDKPTMQLSLPRIAKRDDKFTEQPGM